MHIRNDMNKQQHIEQFYNQQEKLTLENTSYKTYADYYTHETLRLDLAGGDDLTTTAVLDANPTVSANVIAKQDGVIAGLQEVAYFLHSFPIQIEFLKKDGDTILNKDIVLTLNGPVQDILKVERTMLNLLQRMSSIATHTKKYVDQIPKNVLLCPTRKTQWGLLDKRAVTLGDGGTHRLGLYDFVLIKDNHLPYITDLEAKAKELNEKKIFWEIEADTADQVREFATLQPSAIMFDNFSPEDILPLVKELHETYPTIILEASGGINNQTIEAYGKTGVDIISMGSLTHSVTSLDIGLDIV
ncbi:MAG: nicotinate-nucleotide diphosphorylase (carboxylating) [Candidatus Magasanikbacteria bacterium CG_4_9_14_0_2_um_filter_42_11]|uniref:Probable nicotinate-nucleotide pyrophosphorylase [carboxylating] n=1 Tax=Candidatus Magasanikbacteria bacterium CG_4_9_14_0_2_um_filter_42_11 TaxID=1974643 RepID=A0A2M8FAK6_9BACT|nr:MAG: nicotinate-nucleotide diphosphorylase (carboxylating) [Candidatus Magasanikbacteria bacterium CG_4_10_14_0_8_um_filter_42_12]PJC52774.1 MAG: nicotinate-nucleotide diphosphorylase (carboxylating) [Candidatus Magasanikbacteria bacterium CG_4_9_14_0_2_um_filter_42_11]